VIPPLKTRPIRTVLKWQLIATAAVAVLAGVWSGGHGAISATLGGLVNLAAGVVYALLLGVGLRAAPTPVPGAAVALGAMIRAEGGKLLVIIGGLWSILSTYKDIVPEAFFAAFAITVIMFSMAIFVRD
jgi:ATP synthase protein I